VGKENSALRKASYGVAFMLTAGQLPRRFEMALAKAWQALGDSSTATRRRAYLSSVALLFCLALSGTRALAGQKQTAFQPLTGTITDALRRPVPGVVVTLQSDDGRTIAAAITDDHGQFRLPEGSAGTYALTARRKGFKPATMIIILPKSARKHLELVLESEKALTLPVSASRIHPQNGLSQTGTNKYTLTAKDITNLPEGEATPLNQVMLQMPGVVLDQNQEIHIRGEHMGIQYQMNGILLPLDINTDPTFTQLLNAYFVKSVSLMDGVLPAQYGYRTSGVIDIHTKDGCDSGHNDLNGLGRPARYGAGSFSTRGLRRRFQLLPDRALSSVQPGLQLRGARARPDSRRGDAGTGICLPDLCVESDDQAEPDLGNDPVVQSISKPA
jgi:hypothetical protein